MREINVPSDVKRDIIDFAPGRLGTGLAEALRKLRLHKVNLEETGADGIRFLYSFGRPVDGRRPILMVKTCESEEAQWFVGIFEDKAILKQYETLEELLDHIDGELIVVRPHNIISYIHASLNYDREDELIALAKAERTPPS